MRFGAAGLLNIGDNEAFDLGGLVGAVIGTMILLFAYRKLVEGRIRTALRDEPV